MENDGTVYFPWETFDTSVLGSSKGSQSNRGGGGLVILCSRLLAAVVSDK